ncbi:hypothetical protein WA026_014399 [Henosepilachna vigintioctopunctata]|uniref:Uncharacterized protein n=1 Tax=Henosepilachna vigintioctopunctata TaxID=420089 RepID=A0AAW1UNN8_9CUCU
MKFLIVFSVCLVASVCARQVIIRRIVEDDSGSSDPIVIREQQPGSGSGGSTRPGQHGNFLSDLFRKAAQITSATAEGIGNIAQGALQGTASFGEGVINGAQKGLSSALENTGDVAAKFSNGVENQVDNWWGAIAQK